MLMAVAVMIASIIIVYQLGSLRRCHSQSLSGTGNKSIYVPDGNANLFTGRSSEVTGFVTNTVTESDASRFDRVLQKDCDAT